MRIVKIECPSESEQRKFEQDQHQAACDEIAGHGRFIVNLFAAQKNTGSGEEDEPWRAEMRDPSSKKDPRCGTTGRQSGKDADVVNGHHHHDRPSNNVHRSTALPGGRNHHSLFTFGTRLPRTSRYVLSHSYASDKRWTNGTVSDFEYTPRLAMIGLFQSPDHGRSRRSYSCFFSGGFSSFF